MASTTLTPPIDRYAGYDPAPTELTRAIRDELHWHGWRHWGGPDIFVAPHDPTFNRYAVEVCDGDPDPVRVILRSDRPLQHGEVRTIHATATPAEGLDQLRAALVEFGIDDWGNAYYLKDVALKQLSRDLAVSAELTGPLESYADRLAAAVAATTTTADRAPLRSALLVVAAEAVRWAVALDRCSPGEN